MKHKLIMENWRQYLKEDESWRYYGDEGRGEERVQTDRDWKREWNIKADQGFFKNEVKKVHWIGGVHTVYSPNSLEFLLLPKIKSWGNLSSVHKDEISCVGYLNLPLNDNFSYGIPIGILVDGHTSYAASGDVQTEWTSTADEKDIQKYSASGLPKRANIKDNAMYDRESFVEPRDSESGYNELIVDNWKGVALVLDINNKYFKWMYKNMKSKKYRNIKLSRQQEIKEIFEHCKAMGILLLDKSLQNINIE